MVPQYLVPGTKDTECQPSAAARTCACCYHTRFFHRSRQERITLFTYIRVPFESGALQAIPIQVQPPSTFLLQIRAETMGNKQSGNTLHTNMIADKERKMEDAYDLSSGKALGTGTSTQIKQATLKKYTKTERTSGVAIKLYDGKAEIPPDLKKEAAILAQLDHPNIIRLFEVVKVGSRQSLVLELCRGGPLLGRLPFKESQASHIMRQLMSAVSYMHSKNIVHRDIDCSNIMFRTEAEDSDIKLIDFGSATELELVPGHPGAFKFLKEKTGSLHVMAPEVIRQRYGPKADVWSCGIAAYTIMNDGKHPFMGSSV